MTCRGVRSSTVFISFMVRVPVLSKQMTWTEPRLSTAGRWRTSTFWRCISPIPSARVLVATAGNPSGTAATASEIEEVSICSQP